MKTILLLVAVATTCAIPATGYAQVRWYRPGVVAPYGYGVGYGAYGGYYGGYSPVEGYQRGMADVIRSTGQAANDIAKARISNEEARSKYLDNKLKWTEIYWQRKRLGEAEIAKDHAEAREKRQQYQAAQRARVSETLPTSQFDPSTGKVEWPEALQAPEYAKLRTQLEEELEVQANTGTTANSQKIQALAKEMQGLLKEHVHDILYNKFLAAYRFLEKLGKQVAQTT